MPDHKNQHFVPRCHLKPFSNEMAGKAINLFHIKSGRLISNAPVKSQCAHDYFYGEDLVVERHLQGLEGRYATVVRQIIAQDPVDDEAEKFLRDFSYLQYLRTDIAVRRGLLAQAQMADLIFEGAEQQRLPEITQKEFIQMTMGTFAETLPKISDLKVCIIRNDTQTPFVTSDDPAIMINRFYAQRLGPRWQGHGIENAGLMLVLPLSPKFLALSYDGDVYTCTDREQGIVTLEKQSDIDALNLLQFLKASEGIYFSSWADGQMVKASFESVAPKRPEAWHKLHYAVKDDVSEQSGSTRFRVVHSPAERLAAKEALIHLEQVTLDPGVWCSKVKFRAKPKFIDTKSGGGFVRLQHSD